MPAKKNKSWIRKGGQLSKVQMLVSALVVVAMGAGVYKLSSHAGKVSDVNNYATVVSQLGGGDVYACVSGSYVRIKAVSTGGTLLSYWFNSGTPTNAKVKTGSTTLKSVSIPQYGPLSFYGYLHAAGMGGYAPADLPVEGINDCSGKTAPGTAARVEFTVKGLPSSATVPFTTSGGLALGSCGSSVKATDVFCVSSDSLALTTLSYPTQVTVSGKTYHAYQYCGGNTDGTNGAGGCDPQPNGTVQVSDKSGDTIWGFAEVDYR